MSSEFLYSLNCILRGDVESYCLICNIILKNTAMLDQHMRSNSRTHFYNRKDHAILIKEYESDSIFKIGTFYYCMSCNCIIKKSKILRHLGQGRHIHYANTSVYPKRVHGEYIRSYVLFRRGSRTQILKKRQWHGIVDHTCLLCKMDVNNIDKHIAESKHILRLIRTYIKYHNKAFYRQINTKLCQCFDCMELIDNNELKIHLRTQRHIYMQSKHRNEDIKIIPKLETYLSPKVDKGIKRLEVAKIAKENYIIFNAACNKGFCTMCSKFLSSNMSELKSHIEGKTHSTHLSIKNSEISGEVVDIKAKLSFMKTLKSVTYLSDIGVFWINRKYLIPKNNFLMWQHLALGRKSTKCYCFACDAQFLLGMESDHCMTPKHLNMFFSEIIEFENPDVEHFIRQVKPNLFYCCKCNNFFPYWDSLKNIANECKNGNLVSQFETYMGKIVKINISNKPKIFYMDLLRVVFGENICLKLNYS